MFTKVPSAELKMRMQRFKEIMTAKDVNWAYAVFFSKINLYYFTGTMQEGMLIIPRDERPVLWIRRSYDRALHESEFEDIRTMESFRDAAANYNVAGKDVYLETEFVPLAFYKRFQKNFPFGNALSLDAEIAVVRSVKSDYELQLMIHSGKMHEEVLERHVPAMLNEGMSEVDLAALLYGKMLELGHHGVARFGMFDTEVILGHIAFGESSLYPTSFNGPGGNFGMSAAVPLIGNRNNKLKKGDSVFIDIGFGIDGYHTDKTLTYIFKGHAKQDAIIAHQYCLEIQDLLASQLKPGAIPSQIYENLMQSLPVEFLENFMGYGNRQVKFLGHGIGLVIDEYPVIAKGFDAPLKQNMVLALEPKKGIPGFGMVGIENTFLVTPEGGICLTGNSRGMVEVV